MFSILKQKATIYTKSLRIPRSRARVSLLQKCSISSSSPLSSMDLSNKVAIITGAESGIGRATALLFAEHNAIVNGIGLKTTALNSLKSEIESETPASQPQQQCNVYNGNAADPEFVQSYMDDIYNKYERIDIICNIAGTFAEMLPFHQKPLSDVQSIVQNNVWTTVINCHTVIPYMLETIKKDKMRMKTDDGGAGGTDDGCSIVNISSQLTELVFPECADYIMAKSAINGLTKALCAEYAASNIRCNSVHPGPIPTELLPHTLDKEKLAMQIPMRRLGHVNDIAHMFLWLVSNCNQFANGSKFIVDGGFHAQAASLPSFIDENLVPKEI